ncbi:MAG: hypothetical protein U0Q11_11450 [Vicinamibacterales bacterium]
MPTTVTSTRLTLAACNDDATDDPLTTTPAMVAPPATAAGAGLAGAGLDATVPLLLGASGEAVGLPFEHATMDKDVVIASAINGFGLRMSFVSSSPGLS